MVQATDLRCDNVTCPVGIDSTAPELSWKFNQGESTAYQILVASEPGLLHEGQVDLWDSTVVKLVNQVSCRYDGRPLASRQRCYWTVRAWNSVSSPGPWSPTASFELGLLQPADWGAIWIGFAPGFAGRALLFRRTFDLAKRPIRARLYIAGLGLCETHVNGAIVSDRVLDPAWTDFSKRVYYTTYDVTNQLTVGSNCIGAMVGNGWHGTPKLLAQLEVEYEDGTQTRIVTSWGHQWHVTGGPILSNGIYDGEVHDARLAKNGWDTPQGAAPTDRTEGWFIASPVEGPGGALQAMPCEPIRVTDTRRPVDFKEPTRGIFVFDMGQNTAGWARLRAEGEAGQRITMRYAETLREDGTINQDNLQTAAARDVYICAGEGQEQWEPRFTYHGFRYVQVEGLSRPATLDMLDQRVVRSDLRSIGQFHCSNELLNRIHKMVWWTEASNQHGLPTDCPQRNERMGWLNDIAARSEQAVYNFDVSRFYLKWLRDIRDAQDSSGAITDTAPFRLGQRPADPVSVCYLLLPHLLYLHHGTTQAIEENYEGMKAWVEYLRGRSTEHILQYSYYGDWAPPAAECAGNSPGPKNTPGELISTAYYFYSARLFSQHAGVLGRRADQQHYAALAEEIAAAFDRKFWNEGMQGYGSGNQACNSIALYMGIVPGEKIDAVVNSLLADVRQHDDHLTTGNLCTKYMLEVLTAHGHADVAYRLATQTTYPSWGYMLANGATTIWERWENATGGGMNSHNHPMYASIGAWFYRAIGGIVPETPGFKRFTVQPRMMGDLTEASVQLETVRGEISVQWQRQEGKVSLDVIVPPGSRACVTIPMPLGADRCTFTVGQRDVAGAKVEVGCGQHHFEAVAGQAVTKAAGTQITR